MRIGTIGAGRVAQSFARKAIDAGHQVVFSNSRGPESLLALTQLMGPSTSAGTVEDALKCPVILLALPWPAIAEALQRLPRWHSQILIDSTNAFRGGNPDKGLVEFIGENSSEWVAALAPGARVVKAINSMFMSNFEQPPILGRMRRAAFFSGDDLEAKSVVADLLQSFGFAPIDLGSLRDGGAIQSVGAPVAGHDFFVPWPAPRDFPAFNGRSEKVAL